jgi:hypothetical protein
MRQFCDTFWKSLFTSAVTLLLSPVVTHMKHMSSMCKRSVCLLELVCLNVLKKMGTKLQEESVK